MSVPDFAYELHVRVRVDHDRVGGKAVRREEFFAVRGPLDAGHLRGSGERVQARTGGGVPDVDRAVAGAASGGEE